MKFPGMVEGLAHKSRILFPGVEFSEIDKIKWKTSTDIPVIVWNHRWEYDKGPDRLLGALLELKKTGTQFRIHIVGQQFRDIPPVFQEIRSQLGDKIGQWGYIEAKEKYHRLLSESQVVVSTALHDPKTPKPLKFEIYVADYRLSSIEFAINQRLL